MDDRGVDPRFASRFYIMNCLECRKIKKQGFCEACAPEAGEKINKIVEIARNQPESFGTFISWKGRKNPEDIEGRRL